MKPLIKYPGGKAALAAAISAAFAEPCRGTYIEPFTGSGAVYLHRAAAGEVERAHLSDRDGWIAGLHRIVRDDPDGVCAAMAVYRGMAWTREQYDCARAWLNSAGMQEAHAAACFIALNKAGFNGLFRKNKRDNINTAWGKKPHPPGIPDDAHIRQVSALLSRAAVSCSDWQRSIVIASEGDQVYLDPPYVGTWTGYGIGGTWTIDHLAELVYAAEHAAEYGARVVLSHTDDAPTRDLLWRWRVEAVDARPRPHHRRRHRGPLRRDTVERAAHHAAGGVSARMGRPPGDYPHILADGDSTWTSWRSSRVSVGRRHTHLGDGGPSAAASGSRKPRAGFWCRQAFCPADGSAMGSLGGMPLRGCWGWAVASDRDDEAARVMQRALPLIRRLEQLVGEVVTFRQGRRSTHVVINVRLDAYKLVSLTVDSGGVNIGTSIDVHIDDDRAVQLVRDEAAKHVRFVTGHARQLRWQLSWAADAVESPWIDRLYGAIAEQRADNAMDIVMETFDDLLVTVGPAGAGLALDMLDPVRLDLDTLVGVLSITLAAADKLPQRARFAAQVRVLDPARADRLLRGLQVAEVFEYGDQTQVPAADVALLAERDEARAERDKLLTILGFDGPYAVLDVLQILADAADHLLSSHSCDRHGWETVDAAADSARRIIESVNEARADAPPPADPALLACKAHGVSRG